MKTSLQFTLFPIILFISINVFAQDVNTTYDMSTKSTTIITNDELRLRGEEEDYLGYVDLYYGLIFSLTDTSYFIKINAVNSECLLLTNGNKITFLIDDTLKYSFKVIWTTFEIENSILCSEYAKYKISNEFLLKLINAKSVNVRVNGSKYYKDVSYKKDDLEFTKKFVKKYVGTF